MMGADQFEAIGFEVMLDGSILLTSTFDGEMVALSTIQAQSLAALITALHETGAFDGPSTTAA